MKKTVTPEVSFEVEWRYVDSAEWREGGERFDSEEEAHSQSGFSQAGDGLCRYRVVKVTTTREVVSPRRPKKGRGK